MAAHAETGISSPLILVFHVGSLPLKFLDPAKNPDTL